MKSWVPDWAKSYTISRDPNVGSIVEITFAPCDAEILGGGVFPIEQLAHDLAIADVCQQMKEKPLSSRIDVIGQNGNTGEHYDANTYSLADKVADQINPAHYKQGDVECIDAIESALTPDEFRGYCKGNIIKYTWRERYKQGKTAMEKAQWYLERLLKVME